MAASPLLGFVDVPAWPVSIIDFHGLRDTVRIVTSPSIILMMMMTQVVPYSLDQAEMAGPHGSLVAWDGFYFQAKAATLAAQAAGRGCGQEGAWPTAQDGEDGWACTVRAGCAGGAEVVSCTGNFGHNYPFRPR